MSYVIYSESENGYWNNDDGWVDREGATVFEDIGWNLPMSADNDAEWMEYEQGGSYDAF